MNTRLQQSNLDLATQLSNSLSSLAGIKAIVLYGSVGKGYSDASSDIDLVAICDDLANKTDEVIGLLPEYHLAFKKQELSVLQFDQYPSTSISTDAYPSYRAQCAIPHDGRSIDTTIRLVARDVVEKLAADSVNDIYRYQTLMQYVIDTKTLFGDSAFEEWKKSSSSFKSFAPELYESFMNHCLQRIDYYLKGELPDSITRGDIVLRNYELGKGIVLFLNVLYALNDRCLAYPKWEHEDVKTLTIKPVGMQERLKRVIDTQDPAPLSHLLSDLQTLKSA